VVIVACLLCQAYLLMSNSETSECFYDKLNEISNYNNFSILSNNLIKSQVRLLVACLITFSVVLILFPQKIFVYVVIAGITLKTLILYNPLINEEPETVTDFFKNISICGGLLLICMKQTKEKRNWLYFCLDFMLSTISNKEMLTSYHSSNFLYS